MAVNRNPAPHDAKNQCPSPLSPVNIDARLICTGSNLKKKHHKGQNATKVTL